MKTNQPQYIHTIPQQHKDKFMNDACCQGWFIAILYLTLFLAFLVSMMSLNGTMNLVTSRSSGSCTISDFTCVDEGARFKRCTFSTSYCFNFDKELDIGSVTSFKCMDNEGYYVYPVAFDFLEYVFETEPKTCTIVLDWLKFSD
eukprot:TRINITY_DN1370_c0_g1_i1.p1 TRINITY_DN1370_c0_g1~~TRINITY_DN1370_c0_g1_i1.p1  ORF type:complete len:160 (+),score=17.24 TRINITY_DN1370_c0_g1_i1:49-480(+)